MELHRELGITQKSAWYMQRRIHEAVRTDSDPSTLWNRVYRSAHSINVDQKDKSISRIVNPGIELAKDLAGKRFATILADPPWRFENRTGKVAPEHRRLSRYETLSVEDIANLPIEALVNDTAHCYLWVPNALLPLGLHVLESWGFEYKTNLVWHKIRKDGGSDGRGVGFYFRNVTELILFGARGKGARTLQPGRTQVNLLASRKREHSRKPDEQYEIIEKCSWGPFLELFGRGQRKGWTFWGHQANLSYEPNWPTYVFNSSNADP